MAAENGFIDIWDFVRGLHLRAIPRTDTQIRSVTTLECHGRTSYLALISFRLKSSFRCAAYSWPLIQFADDLIAVGSPNAVVSVWDIRNYASRFICKENAEQSSGIAMHVSGPYFLLITRQSRSMSLVLRKRTDGTLVKTLSLGGHITVPALIPQESCYVFANHGAPVLSIRYL